jgi:hypothetical protein
MLRIIMKLLLGIVLLLLLVEPTSGFAGVQHTRQCTSLHASSEHAAEEASTMRRSLLLGGSLAAAVAMLSPYPATAAVGTLPELQDTNIVLQGITVKVSDPLQQKQTITFLQDAFDMVVLRGTPDGADTVSDQSKQVSRSRL